jgi:hypothetical protein
MDERLEKALEFANFKNSFEIQKKTLKEKLSSKLTYGYSGGIFKIDSTLICFVEFLLSQDRNSNVLLMDANENPIMISNLVEFKEEILDRYFSGSLEYFNELQEMKKNRSVGKLVGYE